MQRLPNPLQLGTERLARLRGLAAISVAVLCWVVTAFALMDSELSPGAFLGGAKALFVVLAVLMTLVAGFRARIFRRRG